MPIFGQKKSRTARAATIRDTSSYLVRLQEALRDRRVIVRLLLCLIAMVALLIAVESWKPAFPYRLGERAEHGILAKTDFSRVNRLRTDEAVRDAVTAVHPIFRRVPDALADLPARLRRDLRNVAQAETLNDVPAETRIAFGLAKTTGGGDTSENLEREFATIKAAVSIGEGAGNRIDEMVEDFHLFIQPLEAAGKGTVDPDELELNNIPLDRTIAIVVANDSDADRIVTASSALLTEAIKVGGLLDASWRTYPKLASIRPQLGVWIVRQKPVTLKYDDTATQENRRIAQQDVDPEMDNYSKGQLLVSPGEHIDEERLAILFAQYEQLESDITYQQHIQRVAIIFLLVLVLMVLNGYYIVRYESQLIASAARFSVFLTVVVIAVFLGRLLSFDPWRAEIIPLTATVMVFAIAYNQVLATLAAFTLSLIITLSTGGDLGHFVVLMSVAATAIIPLARVPSRSTIIKVGFLAGATFFAVTWGTRIIASQTLTDVWNDIDSLKSSLKGAGWCVAAGYLVAGSLPFIESTFGVVTNISLLEMSDVSHPLLQGLVQRAPGTYNHSMAVATIGETAADRIGANGLLVRVGAYFHDIGKMLKPDYFVENMSEGAESRHEHLAPAMSTLIIIGHVKDGADLGMQHNLPQTLIDFIEQHHGTTLVEYFYNEATKQAIHRPDHKTDAEESSFRYPGPKPQTREAGVMMLADAVESATRTLDEPTPKRIENLVEKLTMKRLLDGQLDESSLTLTEIKTIQHSLTKSLIGIYHGRIKYPEQRTA
jgi:putative nucleotidyltransferase with HDIG domain